MATDLLTTIRGEIEARLSELRPALEEYEDLISTEAALAAEAEAASGDSASPATDPAAETAAPAPRARYSRPGPRRTAARIAAKPRAAETPQPTVKPRAAGKPQTTRAKPRAAGTPQPAATPQPTVKPRAAGKPQATRAKPRSDETERGILAALEHGSHTASELVMVTAFTAQSIRRSLTRLERAGMIGRTRRDGQTAYVLP